MDSEDSVAWSLTISFSERGQGDEGIMDEWWLLTRNRFCDIVKFTEWITVNQSGVVLVSTGIMQLVKLSACGA